MRLNRRDHAGHDILAPEQANRFRLEARPGTGSELAEQLAVEADVQSQTLGKPVRLVCCPGRPPTNEDFGEAIIGPADTARADRIGILIDRWKPGARRWARDSGVTGQ